MTFRFRGRPPAASAFVDSRLRGHDDSEVIPAHAGTLTALTEDERGVAGTGIEVPLVTAGAGSLKGAVSRAGSVSRRLPAPRSSPASPGVVRAVEAAGRDHCRVAGRTFRDLVRKFHRFAKRGRGDAQFDKANASRGAQVYSTVRRAPRPRSTQANCADPRPQPRIGEISGLALAVALAVVPAEAVDSKPWNWASQGLVDLRARGVEAGATRLVPEPERLGLGRQFLSATVVAGVQAWSGPLTVSGAGRLFARTARRLNERAVRFHVDELYAEYAVTPTHFLYTGRRHIVHGRSLGANPLDIALDPLDLDQSKDTERRRSEVEGQDMLGFESLLGDRFTLAGYWTPGKRALLAGSVTLPEWKFDLTALAFDDERPGAGLSLSRTLGDALLAYADASLRRGRDRMVVRADGRPDAAPGAFLTESDDDYRLFPQVSIGAGYTLESGATFNLEYHFDANGYATGEWTRSPV